MEYHKYALERIRSTPAVILLNGPSVQELEEKIKSLENKDFLYYSVGGRFILEQRILSKIGRRVDVWQLNCTEKIQIYAQEVISFLKDKNSFLLLTTTEALRNISDIIDVHKHDIDFRKIFLIDNLHYNLSYISAPGYNPAHFGTNNALVYMLFFLAECRVKDIFLCGCDGLSSEKNDNNVYYAPETTVKERLAFNTIADEDSIKSAIYADMKKLDQQYPLLVQKLLNFRGINTPNILNINPNSHCSSFPKISYDDFIRIAEKIKNNREAYDEDQEIDLKENQRIYDSICTRIRIHSIHKTASDIENRLSAQLDSISKTASDIENRLSAQLDSISKNTSGIESHLSAQLDSINKNTSGIESRLSAQLNTIYQILFAYSERKNVAIKIFKTIKNKIKL